MRKAVIIILLAIAGSFSTAYAQKTAVIRSDKTGWHKIGETVVDFQRDRDEITVVGVDRFAAIKFRVKYGPIHLMALEVVYENGDKQNININIPFKLKGESRVIDLKGGERNLKKIVFVYKTVQNRKDKKAHVEIWGLKTNARRHNR